jgi:GAF domain-containing protein
VVKALHQIRKLLERPQVGAASVSHLLPIKSLGDKLAIRILRHGSWFLIAFAALTTLPPATNKIQLNVKGILSALAVYSIYVAGLEIASRRFSSHYDNNLFRVIRITVNVIMVSALIALSSGVNSYFWFFYILPIFQGIIYLRIRGVIYVTGIVFALYWSLAWVTSRSYGEPLDVTSLTMHILALLLLAFSFRWLFGLALDKKTEYEEMEALRQTALDVTTAALDRRQLLQTTIQRAVNLLRAKGGGIYEYDHARGELTVVADWGNERSILGHKLKESDGMAGRVVKTGRPLIVNDYSVWVGRAPSYEPELFRAVVEVPLGSQGKIRWVLYVTDDAKGRVFSERDAQMLSLLGSHAVIALRNAEEFENSRRNYQKLRLLYKVSARLSSALNFDDVLQSALEESLKIVGTDEGSIMVLNPRTNELEIRAWMVQGKFSEYKPHRTLALGEGIAGHVALTGRPYNCLDTLKDERFIQSFTGRSLRSVLSVPIVSHGHVLCIINADSEQPEFFKDADIPLLAAVADQVAVAVETQRLRDVGIFLSTLKLDELNAKIVENACVLTGTEASTIFLVNDRTGDIERAATFPPFRNTAGSGPRKKDGLTYAILTTGQPITIIDAQRDKSVRQNVKEQGVKSLMGAPLNVRVEQNGQEAVRTIGVLFVNTTQRRPFNRRDEAILLSLASQAAIAITNARLYKEIELERDHSAKLAAQLLALYESTQEMLSELEVPSLLNLISEQAVNLLHASAGGILLLDEKKVRLSFKGSYGLSPKLVNGTHDAIGESIAGRVVADGQPLIANNIPDDPHFKNPAADGEGILAIISTPLYVNGEIIGTLDVHSKTNPFAFDDEDLKLLKLIASQASLVIERRSSPIREHADINTRLTAKVTELTSRVEVTELKRIRTEETKRERAARELMWKDTSTSAAHAMGNPVFNIETWLDPMEKRIREGRTQEALDILNKVRVLIDKLKKIVDQFKSLTRAQNITPTPVLLHPILEEVKSAAQNSESVCRVECPADLYVYGDFDRLAECFDELTTNALHWARAPKVIEISVASPAPAPLPASLNPSRQYVLISFRDNGPGVPPEAKGKIFELFYTSRVRIGTGIGLTSIRRTVEGHGGFIHENGKYGEGANFEIYLPLVAPPTSTTDGSSDN